jgi:hypothetical protein
LQNGSSGISKLLYYTTHHRTKAKQVSIRTLLFRSDNICFSKFGSSNSWKNKITKQILSEYRHEYSRGNNDQFRPKELKSGMKSKLDIDNGIAVVPLTAVLRQTNGLFFCFFCPGYQTKGYL